jgi:putative ABC transport system permease protein
MLRVFPQGRFALAAAAAAFVAVLACAASPARAVDRLVVESSLAGGMSLLPGDTVHVRLPGATERARAFVVCGTFTPAPDPAGISRTSKLAWTPITDLEALTGREDRASRFVLRLAPGADADSLVAALNATQLGFRAYRSDDVARQSSQTFVVISNFHRAISLLSILAGSAFLAAIVLLQVQELRRSLGVLRVIGISQRRIYTMVVGETVLLANLGAAVGIAVASLVSRAVNAYYRGYFDTTLVFSSIEGWHVGLAFGTASVVGVALGSLATVYLFRAEINEVLGR